jgi:hypothetical protein
LRAVLWLYRNHSNLEQRLSSPTAGRCLTQRESVTAGSVQVLPEPPQMKRPSVGALRAGKDMLTSSENVAIARDERDPMRAVRVDMIRVSYVGLAKPHRRATALRRLGRWWDRQCRPPRCRVGS